MTNKTPNTKGYMQNTEASQEYEYIPIETYEKLKLFELVQPQTATMPIDKITITLSELSKQTDNTKGFNVIISPKDATEIKIGCMFDFEGITTTKDITPKDLAITSAIADIFNAGHKQCTPKQIYNSWKHTKGKGTVKEAELQEIENIIEKLTRVYTTIDLTKLFEAGGDEYKDKIDSPILKGNWLSTRTYTAKINGKKVAGKDDNTEGNEWHTMAYYELLAEPLIYHYAKLEVKGVKGVQLITYDKTLLDIPNWSKTDQRVLLTQAIIKHIELLKGKSKYQNNTITLDRLAQQTGYYIKEHKAQLEKAKVNLTNLNPTKKVTLISNIDYILKDYKKRGYIQGYSFKKKEKSTTSVVILPNNKYSTTLLDK